MIRHTHRLFAVGLAVTLASASSAQQQANSGSVLPSPATSVTSAFGVSLLDDQLTAGGPDYHAEFGPDGVTYIPATPTAERLYPLSMRVTGYGRGEPAIAPGAAERSDRDNTVFYARAGFVETYEAQHHGLKQSFVFSQLPAGSGDLVVRVAVETELTLTHTGERGELTFLHGDHGGVTVGEVIGIDANGARCEGSMSYVGGSLDMRLPADFVAGAALPVVLDPLVGTAFGANSSPSGADETDLDVAYTAGTDRFLAVWTRTLAAGGVSIRGQMIRDNGPIGGLINFGSPANYTPNTARVASVAAADAFVVVYGANSNIRGRAILAGSASPGPVATIANNNDDLGAPDVGGEATASDDDALVVWQNTTQGFIQAMEVAVDATVAPPTVTPSTVIVDITSSASNRSDSVPTISNSGGPSGRHMIVWSRQFSGTPNAVVRGKLVARDLSQLGGLIDVTLTSDGNCTAPSVDGDGDSWIVAWQKEQTSGSNLHDVQARAVAFRAVTGGPEFLSSIRDIATSSSNQRAARVTWTGDTSLILYEEAATIIGGFSNYDLYAQPVDVTALDLGPRLSVAVGGGDNKAIRGASKAMGGAFAEDDTLLVYSQRDVVTNVDTGLAQQFRADDDIHVNLGGGCGSAGFAERRLVGPFANILNLRLRGSRANAPAWVVVSPNRNSLGCGTCTLVPDLFGGWLTYASTDASGNANAAFATQMSNPSLTGVLFYHQWLVGVPSGNPASCAVFGVDLSDAIQTTIQ